MSVRAVALEPTAFSTFMIHLETGELSHLPTPSQLRMSIKGLFAMPLLDQSEPLNGQPALQEQTEELNFVDWLRTLRFRSSAAPALRTSAASGNVADFSAELHRGGPLSTELTKADRKSTLRLLSQLNLQLPANSTAAPLLSMLAGESLNKQERQQAVAEFLAARPAGIPEGHDLTTAIWVLTLQRERLSADSLVSLWRWGLEQGQVWLEARPACDVSQGLSQLRFLEVCLLVAAGYGELKGSRKLLKEVTGLVRTCLADSCDTDGTPQPHWLPGIVETLASLARMTLYARAIGYPLWDDSSTRLISGLLARTLALWNPGSGIFVTETDDSAEFVLLAASQVLETESVAPTKLVTHWQRQLNSKEHRSKGPKTAELDMVETSFQSDWAQLACLRSPWSSAVDRVAVAYDGEVPQLDIVLNGLHFTSAAWQGTAEVDGKAIPIAGDWSCTCWYADDEAHFIELQAEFGSNCKVLRQICLLREEQQLVLNQVLHADGAESVGLVGRLPLQVDWTAEQDSLTRELLMQSEELRVRCLPLSLPQFKTEKANGSLLVEQGALCSRQQQAGDRLVQSVVLDWSRKRAGKPCDWNRLTVAQDGQIEPLDQAAAFRYRNGREQWLMYHALRLPNIPRTVLGLHTPYETVLSRFTTDGTFAAIVEVEV